MGSTYPYYYSDKPKTDMKKIKENVNRNNDFTRLNNLMGENRERNQGIEKNLSSTFKHLKVQKIYLGFNSAFEIFKKYEIQFRKKNLTERDASHPSLFFDFGDGCSYYVDYLPEKGKSISARFLYGKDYGLRYAEKNMEKFVEHNDTLIVALKANADINFYNYGISGNFEKNRNWYKSEVFWERLNLEKELI